MIARDAKTRHRAGNPFGYKAIFQSVLDRAWIDRTAHRDFSVAKQGVPVIFNLALGCRFLSPDMPR